MTLLALAILATQANVPQATLRLVRTVHLAVEQPAPSPFHFIQDFTPAGPGRIAYLDSDNGVESLALVSTSGEPLHSMPMGEKVTSYTWLKDDRFFVNANHQGFVVDAATGSLEPPIAEPETLAFYKVAAFQDGSLVTMGGEYNPIRTFDPSLRPTWMKNDGIPGKVMRSEFRGQELIVDSKGRLLVLSGDGVVHVFSKAGARLATLTLPRSKEDLYVGWHSIAPTPEGGFLISRWKNDETDYVFFDSNGKPLRSLRPVYPNGKPIYLSQHLRFDSAGRLWTSDQKALIELGKDGKAIRILGDPPNPAALASPAAFLVGPDGSFYFVDWRTQALLAFRADGSCRYLIPELHETSSVFLFERLMQADRNGALRFSDDESETAEIEKIVSPDGQRITPSAPAPWLKWAHPPSLQAGNGLRWFISGYPEQVKLVDANNRVVKTLDKTSDGQPIVEVGGAEVAADGTLLITTTVPTGPKIRDPHKPVSIATFSPTGVPLTTAPFPDLPPQTHPFEFIERWNFDGRRIILTRGPFNESYTALGLDGKIQWKCPVDRSMKGIRRVGPDGRLYVYQGHGLVNVYDFVPS